jgi:hypothetical protein
MLHTNVRKKYVKKMGGGWNFLRIMSNVRFPVLPDFLRSSGSVTVSTQPHEYNWGATWKKSSCSGLESREYGRRDPSLWPRGTLSLQKLALTSLTNGGRSMGIVLSRTQTTEFLNIFVTLSCYINFKFSVGINSQQNTAVSKWIRQSGSTRTQLI